MNEDQYSDGLFAPPEQREILPGDYCIVQTIWGDERGTVLGVLSGEPAMVRMAMENGDEIAISYARLRPVDEG